MTWIEPWASRAPLFDADGVSFSDRIREAMVGCDVVAVKAVLAVRRTKTEEPKPVLYCTGADGRAVQYSPNEVRVINQDRRR